LRGKYEVKFPYCLVESSLLEMEESYLGPQGEIVPVEVGELLKLVDCPVIVPFLYKNGCNPVPRFFI
jgi:hypothetical protein